MRPYILIFACLLVMIFVSSCNKNFDCSCVTRGARTEYTETVKAENKDEAFKKCAAYESNVNKASLPGVDCDLK